ICSVKRRKNVKKISSIIGLAAIACGVAFAQKDAGNVFFFANGDLAKVHAEGLASGIATAKFGMMGATVKGAPYSADGVTETTQTLGDGTHINRQETYSISRDGEGRVRRESGDEVWISDPVANVSYILNMKQQTARKLAVVYKDKMPAGTQTVKLKAEAAAAGPIWFRSGAMAGGVMSKSEPEKSEALGKQEMEGVEVDGTRTTTVIPQGQIGNDRPIQTVHERWESAELHVTILSKHTDPMMGDRVERLTNVRRGEPDPALFQVPAGSYRMEGKKQREPISRPRAAVGLGPAPPARRRFPRDGNSHRGPRNRPYAAAWRSGPRASERRRWDPGTASPRTPRAERPKPGTRRIVREPRKSAALPGPKRAAWSCATLPSRLPRKATSRASRRRAPGSGPVCGWFPRRGNRPH